MPAFIYVRVSHVDSAKSGLSAEAQTGRAKAYYEFQVKPKDVPLHPDVFYDAAVSASRTPLLDRPEGERLNGLLRKGDHVIFPRLDRAFRGLKDYVMVVDIWQARGIVIHFADLGVDYSTATGRLVANVIATVAQMYSEQQSERLKEVAAFLKKMNRPVNGQKLLGFKLVNGRWAPDQNDRAVMREIERLHDEHGKTFQECSDHVERRLCEKEGREYKPASPFVKREWSRGRCRNAYLRWKDIQETES